MRKTFYPGGTKPRAVGEVNGIQLCRDDSCDRIEVHYKGVKRGSYMTAITADVAVTLIIKLEREVIRQAAKKGYTCPSLVRLMEHRKAAR